MNLAADLSRVEALQAESPLRLWRAWDRAAPRTSQLRALQLLAVHRTVFVFGGNRSGKTELLRAALVALVLGSDHPDAAAFWRAHEMDRDAFPRSPGRGWIVALRAMDSLEYHRRQILGLIPKVGPQHPKGDPGLCWHAWSMDGKDEARLEIMCPGYDEPAGIVFKSDDPGPDTMQGSSLRVVLHDEESRKHGGRTWEEAGVRLVDQAGWHLMANTPTRGRTWLWEEHVRDQQPGEALAWIHSYDNPYLPRSEVARLERDPVQAAIRTRGEFVALEGRVWPAFSRATHVVPRFEIPDGSPRFRAIDFGTRHPFACLWSALLSRRVDLGGGRYIPERSIVVYREHYRAEQTLGWHVARIREAEGLPPEGDSWEGGEPVEVTWCDPEDPQQILQLAHTYGVPNLARARKAVAAGISVVGDYLGPQAPDGLPGLYVVEGCTHTIREMESYCWGERGESERPTGQVDHAADCVRYTAMGIRVYTG